MSTLLIRESSDDECSAVGEANDTEEEYDDLNRVEISVAKLFN